MYKTGLIIANCRVIREATKVIRALEKKKVTATEIRKTDQSNKVVNIAKQAHLDWVVNEWPVDVDGNPALDRVSSYVVIKFLLPLININVGLVIKGNEKSPFSSQADRGFVTE